MNEQIQRKTMALVGLFSCYPAMDSKSPQQASDTMTSYLTTLADCLAVDVELACVQLAKTNNPFTPSAGQVYTTAERFAAKRAERQRETQLRIGSRPAERTDADRERMQQRVAELLTFLRSPEDLSRCEVLRGTRPAKPIVERRVPESFLERWEREHGKPYPARERVIAELGGEMKYAAE